MAKSIHRFVTAQEGANASMNWREVSAIKTKTRPSLEKLEACVGRMTFVVKEKKKIEKAVKNVNTHTSESESSFEIPTDEGSRKTSSSARCLYCGRNETQLPRHMRLKHRAEPDVQKILNTKGDDWDTILKRKRMWGALRAKGDHLYKKSTRIGDTSIWARKYESSQQRKAKTLPCPHCKYEYAETYLAEHIKYRCSELLTAETIESPDKKFKLSARSESLSVSIKDEVHREVIAGMIDDEVTALVRSDPDIWRYFVHLVDRYYDQGYITTLRGKVRDLSRFVLHVRKNTDLTSVADCLVPANFPVVIKQFKSFAGYNEKTLEHPSKAKRSGEVLKACAERVRFDSILNDDSQLKDSVSRWLDLFNQDFFIISKLSRDTLKERQYNKVLISPLMEDIERLDKYLDARMTSIQDTSDVSDYRELAKVLLAKIILFNRKRQGEASLLMVADFDRALKNQHKTFNEDIYNSLSGVEKELVKSMFRIEFVGKRRGRGACLLTDLMLEAMKRLLKMRKRHVHRSVPFIFAPPGKCKLPIRGLTCLKECATEAKVANPSLFLSTGLRKHLATMSQALHLSENKTDILATFMQHNKIVHNDFYRYPLDTVQKSQVAAILHMVNSGKTVAGTRLEDIDANAALDLTPTRDAEGTSRIMSDVVVVVFRCSALWLLCVSIAITGSICRILFCSLNSRQI